MQTIKMRSRVREDGVLYITLPQNLADTHVEVTIQPATVLESGEPTPDDLGWPSGFIDATYGSLRDEPIVR